MALNESIASECRQRMVSGSSECRTDIPLQFSLEHSVAANSILTYHPYHDRSISFFYVSKGIVSIIILLLLHINLFLE